MPTDTDATVIELLLAQHDQIEQLLHRVSSIQSTAKREPFEDLVRLLAVHESAEEEILHPFARRSGIDQGIVDNRLAEENQAKHVLSELYELGVENVEFDTKFQEFAHNVIEHARNEEKEEFNHLAEHCNRTELTRLATLVRAAEAIAPTRPHPSGGESAAANLLAGPPLAIFDRVRDMVRDWNRKAGE
ncbi:hemerythrin domain-containing protein [Nocardia sp. CA2R105]|uniref:hemerythrin domain-containing protein n=1 Tax=Nocardia coffeae TaxID=2873381 RepID=UPI001CA695D6|nr:hemerythrin domain-containing protein [Nocardia coffeae]MBY8860409.1 hemerythrin domain-containing protein [Nocardia coffeae]